MSDTAPATQAPKPQPPAVPTHEGAPATTVNPEPQTPAQETDWKAEARKWEARAKEYKPAADRLAEMEEASKSETQKAAERAAAAEKKAAEAEAKVVRRDVAIEHSLSKEDAALLDDLTDEGAMRRLAVRLSAAASDKRKQGNVAPREGSNPSVPVDKKREFLRSLTE